METNVRQSTDETPQSSDEMVRCGLCGDYVPSEDATHLTLYVYGSEGVRVCLGCRQTLTECARGIRSASTRAHKRGWLTARHNTR